MVVADLHVHTTNSDGSLALSEVPAAARAADISTVAITDHDRLHPDLPTPVGHMDGVTIVHGIELRVEAGDQRLDLLGYGVRPTAKLQDALDGLQRNRIERGRAIAECVEDRLDIDLDIEFAPGLGRPHIARAIDEADGAPDWTYQRAFDELIGDGCPCYVSRDIPSFERGIELLSDACGLVSLAHPFRYGDTEAALEYAAELDAIERYYPYEREVDVGRLDRAMQEHDLIPTGGSDAHGEELGKAGLDRREYRLFRSRVRA